MSRGILVDAGPLVAILHRDDQDHQLCVDTLRDLRGPLFTTWILVTEAIYLLEFSVTAQGALLEMIERRALQVLGLDADDMPAIRTLMNKYKICPWISPMRRSFTWRIERRSRKFSRWTDATSVSTASSATSR